MEQVIRITVRCASSAWERVSSPAYNSILPSLSGSLLINIEAQSVLNQCPV